MNDLESPDVQHAISELTPAGPLGLLTAGLAQVDGGEIEAGAEAIHRGYAKLLGPKVRRELQPALPSYWLIGAPKCGTTTLSELLVFHPDVVTAPRKEIQFWRHHPSRSAADYLQCFPRLVPGSGLVVGDASTALLYSRKAPTIVASNLPDVALVMLYRDPVSRAYSHYNMEVRTRRELRPFAEVVDGLIERFGADAERLDLPEFPSTLLQSVYEPYLRHWFEHVDSDRLLLIPDSALRTDTQAVLDRVQDHIGLRRASVDLNTAANTGHYEPIDPTSRERLERFFSTSSEAFERLLAEHPNRFISNG